MNETQQLLNYVSNIEDIVDLFASVKPVEFWVVEKNILYVSLQEELYLYEKQKLHQKFVDLTGENSKEFFTIDESDNVTFKVNLK